MLSELSPLRVNAERFDFIKSFLSTNSDIQVWGLGTFGGNIALIEYLCKKGCFVTLYEQKKESDLKNSWAKLKNYQSKIKVYWECDSPKFNAQKLIFVSPAISPTHTALKNSKPEFISTEIEIALCLLAQENSLVHAVIGSVGKSTCSSLLALALTCEVYGNIGEPLLAQRNKFPRECVLELSSFQLHYLRYAQIKPSSFLCTPIKDNHVHWHGSLEEYQKSKMIPMNQWIEKKVIGFDMNKKRSDEPKKIILELLGEHNQDNAKAVVTLLKKMGRFTDESFNSIKCFKGLPHRLEIIDYNKLRFINDSKATSPNATLCALKSVKDGCVLILQGMPIEGCEAILNKTIQEKCLKLVLISGMQNLFQDTFFYIKVSRYQALQDYFFKEEWSGLAENTDVLFSPSAPSYDQYLNYEKRGEDFKDLVFKS